MFRSNDVNSGAWEWASGGLQSCEKGFAVHKTSAYRRVFKSDTEGFRTMGAVSTTSVKLDAETKDRVQRLASIKQRSTHWLMREAIEQYVAREEKQEQQRQDALAVWEEYRTTGLHVTAEEADAWLAKLEAGEDVEPPACHV